MKAKCIEFFNKIIAVLGGAATGFITIKYANYEGITLVLTGMGMALITILISVAIFIFSDNKNPPFEWDRLVILKKIIKPKRLLVYVVLVFMPFVFWNKNTHWLNIFILGTSFAGLFGVTAILHRSYEWMSSFDLEHSNNTRYAYRKTFLEELKDPQEIEIILGDMTWNSRMELNFEMEVMAVFYKKMAEFIESQNFGSAKNIAEAFHKNILKRNIIYTHIYAKMLEVFFDVFFAITKVENADSSSLECLITTTIQQLVKWPFENINKKEGVRIQFHFYHFIQAIKRHIENESFSEKYILSFFRKNIRDAVFGQLGNKNAGYFWGSFPENWKTTLIGCKENNPMGVLWYQCFIEWVFYKKKDDKPPSSYTDILTHLFLEVDLDVFSRLLAIYFIVYNNLDQSRLEAVIKNIQYWHVPSTPCSSLSLDIVLTNKNNAIAKKANEEVTFEFVNLLFPKYFLPNIDVFIANLKLLENDGDYLNLFEKMQIWEKNAFSTKVEPEVVN